MVWAEDGKKGVELGIGVDCVRGIDQTVGAEIDRVANFSVTAFRSFNSTLDSQRSSEKIPI